MFAVRLLWCVVVRCSLLMFVVCFVDNVCRLFVIWWLLVVICCFAACWLLAVVWRLLYLVWCALIGAVYCALVTVVRWSLAVAVGVVAVWCLVSGCCCVSVMVFLFVGCKVLFVGC